MTITDNLPQTTKSAKKSVPALPAKDSIPVEMRTEDRWVCWKYQKRDGNDTKVPVQPSPTHSELAKSNDPETWSTFDNAYAKATLSGGELGIGFMLGGDSWCGLDLDHVLDKNTGEFVCDKGKDIIDGLQGCGHAEVSPSGTGVKVMFWTAKPSGYRSRTSLNKDIGSELEFYGDGRFFTVTGNTSKFEDFRVTRASEDAVEALLENHLSNEQTSRPAVRVDRKLVDSTDAAERYVESIIANTSQPKGGRNNKLFNIAGNIAKKVGYDFQRTYQFASEVNQKCFIPPLPDREVAEVVLGSIERGNRRIDSPEFQERNFKLLAQQASLPPVPESIDDDLLSKKAEFDYEALMQKDWFKDTPLAQMTRHIYGSTESNDLALCFGTSLIGLGAILTGRVSLNNGKTWTNLQGTAVAESGDGKTTRCSALKDIAKAIGMGDRLTPSGLNSAAGFISELTVNPWALFILEEQQDRQSTTQTDGSRIMMAQMKEAADQNGQAWLPNAYGDRSKNSEIESVAPSLIKLATEDYWKTVPESELGNGSFGRTLFFCGKENDDYSANIVAGEDFYCGSKPVPESLKHVLQAMFDPSPQMVERASAVNHGTIGFRPTKEASEAMAVFRREVVRTGSENKDWTTPIWKRSDCLIQKVALILACNEYGLEGKREIGVGHVELAMEIVKSSVYTVQVQIEKNRTLSSDGDFLNCCKMIKNKLTGEKGLNGTTERSILHKKNVKTTDFNRAMTSLIASGEVVHVPSHLIEGWREEKYFTANKYKAWLERQPDEIKALVEK